MTKRGAETRTRLRFFLRLSSRVVLEKRSASSSWSLSVKMGVYPPLRQSVTYEQFELVHQDVDVKFKDMLLHIGSMSNQSFSFVIIVGLFIHQH